MKTEEFDEFKEELRQLFKQEGGARKVVKRIEEKRAFISTTNRTVLDNLKRRRQTASIDGLDAEAKFRGDVEQFIEDLELSKSRRVAQKRGIIGVASLVLLALLAWYFFPVLTSSSPKECKVFDSTDTVNYKVLLLRFTPANCEAKDDIANEVARQLNIIGAKEKIPVKTHLAVDIFPTVNFNQDSAARLKEEYCADLVLYGNYRRDDCTAQDVNDACAMWYTGGERPTVREYEKINLSEIKGGDIVGNTLDIAYFALGNRAIEKKNYPNAIKLLKKVRHFEASAIVQNTLGISYYSLNQYYDARNSFEKAIEINEGISIVYNNLARLLEKPPFQEYYEAKKLYEKAIKIDEGYASSYNNLAGLLEKPPFQEYNVARKLYEKAIKVDESYAEAYNNLAGLLEYPPFQEYDEARRLYEKAIEIDENDVIFYSNLAGLLVRPPFQEYNKAKKLYERAIEINGNFAELYHNLAGILKEPPFQEYDEARKLYEKAIKIDKSFALAYNNLAALLSNPPFIEYEGVKKNMEKAIQLGANNAEINASYAMYLFYFVKTSPLVHKAKITKHYQKAAKLDSTYRNRKEAQQFEKDFQATFGHSPLDPIK